DYFKLIIHGLDENYEDNEGATVEYYLAKNEVGGIENLYQSADWEWVDLSPLGEVYGLYYTMETTDMSYGWPNTSTYFCMDKLQVKIPGTDTRMKTPETKIAVSPNPFTEFIVINSHTSELATIYDLSGKVILTVKLHAGSNRINTSALAKGAYIVKTGGNAVKIVK
ncbi:MAG: DUF4465 domain-containing protein, partial [Dysgonamonadaceae bacterium]|nr:DUF4465 domain-containing protein [Dysgonamonadaceae bacterium]